MKSARTTQVRRSKDQKRVPLSMRITPQVREKLVEASERSGRSLTQEAEIRLESSFRDQDIMIESLKVGFGQEVAALLLLIGRRVRTISGIAHFHLNAQDDESGTWLDNPLAYSSVAHAIARYLEALRPEPQPGDDNRELENITDRLAASVETDLRGISGPPVTGSDEARPWDAPFYSLIRQMLGTKRTARVHGHLASLMNGEKEL